MTLQLWWPLSSLLNGNSLGLHYLKIRICCSHHASKTQDLRKCGFFFKQLGMPASYDKITDVVLRNKSPKRCAWINTLIIASILKASSQGGCCKLPSHPGSFSDWLRDFPGFKLPVWAPWGVGGCFKTEVSSLNCVQKKIIQSKWSVTH